MHCIRQGTDNLIDNYQPAVTQFGNETSWKVLQKVDGDGNTVGKGSGRAEMASSLNDVPSTPYPSYFPTYYPTSSPRRFLRESSPRSNRRRAQAQQPWTVVLQGGPYSYRKDFDDDSAGTHYNAIVANTCLPVGSYRFILYDAKVSANLFIPKYSSYPPFFTDK